MNTLKSAALLVVLLGVLYGVYVALNKPDSPTTATVRREKRFPTSPLIAAPASGKSGMTHRWRFGVIV